MYHIIFNPVAGKKNPAKNLRAVTAELDLRNIEYKVHESHAVRDAESIAFELSERGEKEFIVLGGDGTLHEVLNGLSDPAGCKIGLIPSGTGNDFAEKQGIPMDAKQAVLRIVEGEAKPVDYLQVGSRRCMNVAGLGIDVDVLERCNRGKLKGKIKYLWSLVGSFFAFKGYRVRVECEGRVETHDALICAACNGTQFGGGIKICPPAETDDGKLDVIVVDLIGGKWKIIKAFVKLLRGQVIEYPLTTYIRADSVQFIPENSCTVQLDGELYENLDFNAKICKGLLFY